MSPAGRAGLVLVAGAIAIAIFGAAAQAPQPRYPKPTELPNPYRLVEGWPTLPNSMNGGRWGEVIRVHVASDGNIWVFHRCFNTVPPGHATCIGRGDSNPPILEFDPSGKLLKSFGVGLFAYPHAFLGVAKRIFRSCGIAVALQAVLGHANRLSVTHHIAAIDD